MPTRYSAMGNPATDEYGLYNCGRSGRQMKASREVPHWDRVEEISRISAVAAGVFKGLSRFRYVDGGLGILRFKLNSHGKKFKLPGLISYHAQRMLRLLKSTLSSNSLSKPPSLGNPNDSDDLMDQPMVLLGLALSTNTSLGKYFWELWSQTLVVELDCMQELLGLKKAEEETRVSASLVSALALLSLAYQYLTGYIDRGGTKTYSPGSLEFRSTYIAIVLFQGAYVWIKFRDDVASSSRSGYRRPVTDKLTGTIKLSDKIEARYSPPRDSGNCNCIYLGLCASHEEAEIKKNIAAFYYGRHTGRLDLDGGHHFLIPPMSSEEQEGLSVPEKRAWVKMKVREVYEAIKHPTRAIQPMNVHHDEQNIDARLLSSHSDEEFQPVLEGLSFTSDLEFRKEEYDLPLPDEDMDAEFCKFLDSSEFMSELPDAEPQQHPQDDHVQGLVIGMPSDSQYHSFDIKLPGTESIQNVVHGSSDAAANPCVVDLGGLTKEGAPHNSQPGSEFPVMSPVSTLQQHSDANAIVSNMVTPSFMNILCSRNSTSEYALALKMISLLEQQLEDKNRRIVELEREVQGLRGS